MIPSRQILKDNLKANFDILRMSEIDNIADLSGILKSKTKIDAFAEATGLSSEYLTLLRREANSYFPSPVKLSRFIGVDEILVSRLEGHGIKTSKQLFELVANRDQYAVFLRTSGFTQRELSELISLSDLSRLYGVGPAFAGMLFEAGLDSVQTLMRFSGEQIRKMYEEKTQRTADFTARDIDFTLEIAKELESSM